MAEPGDSGLQSQLTEFWNSWHDLANAPGDGAARSQLLQRANTLADGLHSTEANMATQWRGARTQLTALVDEVNTTAGTISELNVAIRRDAQAGIPANELADERDRLVMQLADQMGATVKSGDDGSVDVYIGGSALVRGATVQKLQVSGATSLDQTKATPPIKVAVSWAADGYPAAVELGEAAGRLDVLNTMLPAYSTDLDNFAVALGDAVNNVHSTGYGSDGVNGRVFFSGTTAATFGVAITNKDQVAASSLPGGVLDGGTADAIAKIASQTNGPDGTYRQMVTDLGVEAQTANRRSTIQQTITTQVDASRESQSGVDLDEEMTNMLAFQHAYERRPRAHRDRRGPGRPDQPHRHGGKVKR